MEKKMCSEDGVMKGYDYEFDINSIPGRAKFNSEIGKLELELKKMELEMRKREMEKTREEWDMIKLNEGNEKARRNIEALLKVYSQIANNDKNEKVIVEKIMKFVDQLS